MSTMSTETFREKQLKDELKAKRIKEAKQMEKQAAFDVVANYKELQSFNRQQEEKTLAIEKYHSNLRETEELTKMREDILIAKEQGEQDQERNKQLTIRKKEEDTRRANRFEMNSVQRAKDAKCALENEKMEKMQYFEEVHQFKAKQRVKEEQKEKAKVITQIYKGKEKEREAEEAMIESNPINVAYKITTPYHNNGNQIDYTTTRFHNILVERHEDDLTKLINVNAFEKAKEESQKAHKRVKSKEKAVQQFNSKTNENFKEIIRKNKAKECLEAFQENFDKVTRIKSKNPAKNKKVTPNANVVNAKEKSKKAEHFLNKKLAQQKGNRQGILNNGESQPAIQEDVDIADDESIRNFYKEDADDPVRDDDYLTKAISEHNSQIDEMNRKYHYEEPIARDPQPLREKIANINAVDLDSYQKAELADKMVIFHKEPIVANKRHKHLLSALMNEIESEVTESKFSVLEALKISRKVIEDEEKERLNKKDMNKAVRDFYAKLNSSKVSNKVTLSHIEEEKKEEMKEEEKAKPPSAKDRSKQAIDVKEISKETISSINKDEDSGRINKAKDIHIKSKANPPNSSIPKEKPKKEKSKPIEKKPEIPSITPKEKEIEGETDQQKPEEFKRDETKWKYSKQELYERKKQLLKDKSNIKK